VIPADEIEANMIEIVRMVSAAVRVPMAVKLSPFHTATAHTASMLMASGAAGLVLFN
jgi:dihydroorotate dehydrogenase (fumarate)